MLQRIMLCATFALATVASTAQEDRIEEMMNPPKMEVGQENIKFQKQSMTAHSIYVNADAGDTKKALEDFFVDKYKVEFEKVKGMQVAQGVVMNDIINETVTLAIDAKSEKSGSLALVIVDLGGVGMNPSDHPQGSASLERLLKDFGKSVTATQYVEVIKTQEKITSKSEKAYDKLVKAGEKIVSNSEKDAKEIADSEEAITKKEQEVIDLKAKIEQLKKDIEQLERDKAQNAKEQEQQKKAVEAEKQKLTKLRTASESFK